MYGSFEAGTTGRTGQERYCMYGSFEAGTTRRTAQLVLEALQDGNSIKRELLLPPQGFQRSEIRHGHGTDRCYRLRHEVQNLIDNRTIAPPQDPNDPHLNLIHTLPPTFNPNIYITPTHLPKPDVFIPESMNLCMMDALEPQSSQTREPTTFELMRMIKDLQRTVTDLAFEILAPSLTTSHARNFTPKGSLILGCATLEEGQSLSKVEANGKNKVGAGIGKGHLKPLEPRPLLNPLQAKHDAAKYCAFHQQTGDDTNLCFRLRHEIQDLIDNEVIIAPGPTKSIGTGSVNLGDNVIM
ncbi:hypothetical protein HYC85_030788 [Camellia sinensis]|uniref:Uncharacterized protein n=1 Tax=Camellia sinensis TaxID=4442 RepID=A0A7J7G294_CAMSI|nr:hypothetical protein HYC85_030788 [Camellia sinensis]